ncbi:hypothetical protein LPB90_18140 [Chryseobacterium sp. LC2016-29]|uniref:hypothetical protein n=1 Tax=Chryseobacterium sp. LC2016-29 TaxID=2897331 RepID=UPI001E35F485|nr:hypothetical protein [Chryseobacterium sp. LC2016-29]MCD0480362.1 hypothetical protein [Chryseobacterium sp. LC2016-29]
MKKETKNVDVSIFGDINSFKTNLKEGDSIFQQVGKIMYKWEIVEILKDRIYAVDNDGFGRSFDFNELTQDKSFTKQNITITCK